MIVGVSMVKDEEDILAVIIGHLLAEGVDRLVIADNLSTDGTRDILESFPEVTVLDDPVVAYYQAEKMTRLAHLAGDMGATWIVPFDADELWYSTDHKPLGRVLRETPHDVLWSEAHHHVPHPDDPTDGDPVERMRHCRTREELIEAKVAFRYHPKATLHMGNHNVDHPGKRCHGQLAFREFQYRSFDHFCRKVRNGKRAYDATDLPADCGIHWRHNGGLDDAGLRSEWETYLSLPTTYDPAPLRRTDDFVRLDR